MTSKYVVIVAGGSGTRIGAEVPKQFLLLGQKPIIVHTIEAFLSYQESIHIVLVLPEAHFDTWAKMKSTFLQSVDITLSKGGSERTDSVRNGLSSIAENSSRAIVAIHDAVRPFVSVDVITQCFESASKHGSGIAAVQLKDSIREQNEECGTVARDRSRYSLVQTPQCFILQEIVAAYDKISSSRSYTDDASVFEAAGGSIALVNGNYENIKITTPEDLLVGEALITKKRPTSS